VACCATLSTPDSRPTQLAPVDEGERTMIRTVRGRVTVADARQGWVHYLTYTDEQGVLQRLRLTDAPLRIGRRAPCELVIKDGEISGVHCELQLREHDLFVSDRGSTNGTFVDGKRIFAAAVVPHGGVLQVGRQVLKHEFRDERELEQSQELDRDLAKAAEYVRSLLPPPLAAGPLHTAWFYQPSTRVGGDAFGYHPLDERRIVLYLLDVSGHGVGAAMHAVSVMNTLRQRTLPGVDFGDPAQVLEQLNAVFPMDGHGGMFFTIWYGVLDLATRELRFSAAGQHPAYALGGPGSVPRPLAARNLVIGAMPGVSFEAASTVLAPDERLYLFSDGVYEIVSAEGQVWQIEDFLPLLGHAALREEPEHLFRVVRGLARPGPLDDDFSLLVITAPAAV
jgi:serine phosphatase RsbU (regulator of sigma subunit)